MVQIVNYILKRHGTNHHTIKHNTAVYGRTSRRPRRAAFSVCGQSEKSAIMIGTINLHAAGRHAHPLAQRTGILSSRLCEPNVSLRRSKDGARRAEAESRVAAPGSLWRKKPTNEVSVCTRSHSYESTIDDVASATEECANQTHPSAAAAAAAAFGATAASLTTPLNRGLAISLLVRWKQRLGWKRWIINDWVTQAHCDKRSTDLDAKSLWWTDFCSPLHGSSEVKFYTTWIQ